MPSHRGRSNRGLKGGNAVSKHKAKQHTAKKSALFNETVREYLSKSHASDNKREGELKQEGNITPKCAENKRQSPALAKQLYPGQIFPFCQLQFQMCGISCYKWWENWEGLCSQLQETPVPNAGSSAAAAAIVDLTLSPGWGQTLDHRDGKQSQGGKLTFKARFEGNRECRRQLWKEIITFNTVWSGYCINHND